MTAKIVPMREARARLRPEAAPVPLEAWIDFERALRVWRLKHAQRCVRAMRDFLQTIPEDSQP